MSKRPGTMSDDERAEIGRSHRAAPLVVVDEITGRYEGDELAAMRATRSTDDRIARLEDWKDKVTPVIYETGAKVSTLLDLAGRAEAERERRAARDAEERERKAQADQKALDSKRRHLIALVGALGVAIASIVAAVVR